ncbi:MFS transporter [Antrihabitans cavernicola]|uniref:MFS transporter n=1 Tax=Antrihabitans cavernicola TaxID=2495913 RepID=A0A5A7SF09_9NOCA|nr:MFS transporter [Spelaeibacter cavernicola]KAA0024426.1 MFS transporter [Spelaeibacter cavernicola]
MTRTLARPIPIPDNDVPDNKPGSKRTGVLLAVILTGQFMAVLDAAIVNVAIPSIQTSLHASGAGLQLVIAGYVIAYAVLLVTGARLGDRLSQRRVFMIGLALFTAASLACGLAWTTEVLVAFRFAQGIGAALMVPQVMTLIQRTFTGPARARALSAYAAVISGGAVVGQVLGGAIVTADLFGSGWRGVFLVNVPIGVILLVFAFRILPRTTAQQPRKLDVAGLLTLSPAVLLLVFPLVLGRDEHWPVWGWIALVASVVVFGAFVVVERGVAARGGAPLFPGRLLRVPGLLLTAATMFLVMGTFSGWLFVMAIHLQNGLGNSPLQAGLLFIPNAACFAIASLNWERIPERLHSSMIRLGMAVAAITMVVLGVLLRGGGQFGPVELIVFGFFGFGFGFAFSPLMNRALSSVPVTAAADASGILVTSVQLGMVVGVASFGTLFLGIVDRGHSTGYAVGITAIVEGVTLAVAAFLAHRAVRTHRAA